MTPLHLAAIDGRPYETHYLTNNGTRADIEDKNSITPLHYAVQQGHEEVAKILINAGANVNKKMSPEQWEWTPLHVAVKYKFVEMVRLLVRNGADINARDAKGGTPLSYATENTFSDNEDNQNAIINFLLRNGANLR